MGSVRPDAKEKAGRAVSKLSKQMKRVGDFLVAVVVGDEKDVIVKVDKEGKSTEIKRPASLAVRVSAAKQYKELIIDKLLPDTKENPKKQDTSRKKVTDELRDLEQEIHAAKASQN